MGDNILEAINEAVAALGGLTDAINAQQGGNTVVPICCEDIPPYYSPPESDIEEDEGDPPPPYATWEEWRADKCKRAWTAVIGVETALFDIYDKQEIGVTLGIAVIALIIAPILAPYSVAIALGAIVLAGSYQYSFVELRSRATLMRNDVMCAIYLQPTVNLAAYNVVQVIEASDMDAKSKSILNRLWTVDLLNAIFDQTLTIDPAAPDTCDCALPCEPCVCEVKPLYKLSGDGLYSLSDGDYLLGPQDGVGAVITCTQATGGCNAVYALDVDLGEQVVIGAGQAMRITVVSLVNQIACVGSRNYYTIENSDRGDYHSGPTYDPGSGWTQFHSGAWIPMNINGGTIVLDDLPGPQTVRYIRLRWQMTFQCGTNNLNKYAIVDSVCYEIV